MIQEIGNRVFDNQYRNQEPRPEDYILIFRKAERGPDQLLIADLEDGIHIPTMAETNATADDVTYMFSIDEVAYYLARPGSEVVLADGAACAYEFMSNRALRRNEPGYVCFAAMTACHLNAWYKDNQFCGRCGAKAAHDARERMMRCPECGNMIFPKICPAVTVALRAHDEKRGELLMVTRYAGRAQTGHALIAGFVEIGESAEECVVREVLEEVGIEATNVRYFGSQPWGFAGNLQIGYVAEAVGSLDVVLDETELSEGRWITRDELSENTNLASLTATMIEEFRRGNL
ncbi:MAG: NAD(+) diphosphatase [Oscillospiraceae bacterium]|nr:NAD(+) diphosphatase [Oscillospiraceae bacterium]